MSLIQAIYENGVFRPVDPVSLPEHCRVQFVPQIVEEKADVPTLDDVYAILSRRHDTGERDVAERHNEHQP